MHDTAHKRLRSTSPLVAGEERGGADPDVADVPHHVAPVQVLHDLLRRTSLAELRDREIVEWLTEAERWLRTSPGAGGAELRFLILGVLHTMPWWRVVESVAGHCKAQPGSAAVTRWHRRLQLALERVCLLLLEQSPHTVPAVLEVVMRPFHLRPPVHDGACRVIPHDSVIRLINAVATRYSASYVQDLLTHCLATLTPRRRWPDARHHLACAAIFLHLALEGQVPSYEETLYVPTMEQLLRDGENGAAWQLPPSAAVMRSHVTRVAAAEAAGTSLCEGRCGAAQSCAASHGAVDELTHAEAAEPRVGASNADDVPSAAVPSMSDTDAHVASAAAPSLNNRMLGFRDELIRFILQWLLEKELTLERPDPEDVGGVWERSTHSDVSSPVLFSTHAVPSTATSTPSLARVRPRLESSAPCTPHGTADVSAMVVEAFDDAARPFLRILQACTTLVFVKLAEDLRRQQTAGACGNAEWWRELLAFHVGAVLRVERPVCLLYLAPSLALLGAQEEAVDMMHKLVSLVTKGYVPVTQKTSYAGRSGGSGVHAAQPVRMRMPPPTARAQNVPLPQRLRAALYLFPLYRFMRERLDEGEGVRRRMLKWIAREVRAHGAATRLVETVFAQCAAIAALLALPLLTAPPSTDAEAPDTIAEALQPLIQRYELKSTTVADPEKALPQFDLAQMELQGLLRPRLMDECPWGPVLATMAR